MGYLNGFADFIRKQGVVGLAVGFILGGSVAKVVTALVTDIINPILSVGLGAANGLKAATFSIGSAQFLYGDFLSTLIDFVVVASVVYFGVKGIGLDRLDKKEEKK